MRSHPALRIRAPPSNWGAGAWQSQKPGGLAAPKRARGTRHLSVSSLEADALDPTCIERKSRCRIPLRLCEPDLLLLTKAELALDGGAERVRSKEGSATPNIKNVSYVRFSTFKLSFLFNPGKSFLGPFRAAVPCRCGGSGPVPSGF